MDFTRTRRARVSASISSLRPMVSGIHYFFDVEPDTERRASEAVRAPAWHTMRDHSGFRGLTVVMDAERQSLMVVTLRSDADARDRSLDRLAPLFEAMRLALGASRAERHAATVVDDVRVPDAPARR